MPFRQRLRGCPRCERDLEESRLLTGHAILSCRDCGGSFVRESVLTEVATRMLDNQVVDVPGSFDDPGRDRADRDRTLGCPECHAPLSKHTVFGADVDRCAAHGIWLDLGELQAILKGAEAVVIRCPGCQQPMQPSADHGRAGATCPGCRGRWLSHAQCEQTFGEAAAAPDGSGSRWFANESCPTCDRRLERTTIADESLFLCIHHGVFWPAPR